MKRLGLALVGFWVVLGVVVAVVALRTDDSPSPAEKSPGPMTCASLQERAERCADALADLAGKLYAEHLERQGESAFGISTKRTLAATVVYGAIGDKKVAAYCKRYRKSDRPRVRQARVGLAACFKKPGCVAFTDCLRKLARRLNFTSF